MNNEMPSQSFVWWFRFSPHKFARFLSASDIEAGKRFKEFLSCLIANEAPQGSIEAEMIDDAKSYSHKQRDRANKRWNKEENPPVSQPVVNVPPPQLRRPTRPLVPSKEIDIGEVYDFCDANGIIPTIGKEWHEYMSSKGWSTLTGSWHKALQGFAKKKPKP